MKLDKAKKDLKARLEKLGIKVYFSKQTVRLFWPGRPGSGIARYTYREAHRLAKGTAGDGKSVRPWGRSMKEISHGVIRAAVRGQINAGNDDIHYPPKLADNPRDYD